MEDNDLTILSVQRTLKPKIEDVIPQYLDGDLKINAQDFVIHMQENKMALRWAGVHNAWKAIYRGKPICYVRLADGSALGWLSDTKNAKFTITPYFNNISEYEHKIISEGWQKLIWGNLFYCHACNNGCAPGANKTILGNDFKGICNGILFSRFAVSFVNPDEIVISRIKILLDYEKQARDAIIKKSNE